MNNSEQYLTSDIIYSGVTLKTDNCGITLCQGNALNTVIKTLYDKLCDISTECTVMTSATDECCGYLQGKLLSSDNSISIEKVTTVIDDANCETLDLTVNVEDVVHVLYNNQTTVSLTSADDFQTYTLPLGTLKTNGDILEITSLYFTTGGTGDVTVTLGALQIYTDHYTLSYTFNPRRLYVTLVVTRINSTHVAVDQIVNQLDSTDALVSTYIFRVGTAVVPNLDSTDLDITSTLSSVSGESISPTIHNVEFIIKYFNA